MDVSAHSDAMRAAPGGNLVILGITSSSLSNQIAAQGIALLPLLSICWMIALTDGGNSVYYAGLNIVLVGLSLLLRWNFWNSLGMIVCCCACYALSVWISPVSPEFDILFGNSYFLFVTSVFVMAGSSSTKTCASANSACEPKSNGPGNCSNQKTSNSVRSMRRKPAFSPTSAMNSARRSPSCWASPSA